MDNTPNDLKANNYVRARYTNASRWLRAPSTAMLNSVAVLILAANAGGSSAAEPEAHEPLPLPLPVHVAVSRERCENSAGKSLLRNEVAM